MINGLSKYNSNIYKALLKYNYINFRLEILQSCDSNDLIQLEKYYIYLLKPALLGLAGP